MHRSIKFLIYRRYIKKKCIQKLTFYLWFVLKKCLFLQRNFAQNLNIIPIMKKDLLAFVGKLNSVFTDLFDYPTIKIYSDYVELYFDTYNTIRSLDVFNLIVADEFRMFPSNDGKLTVVYTFYFSDDVTSKI